MKVVEFLYEDKVFVGFFDDINCHIIHVLKTPHTLYSMIRYCFDNNIVLLDFLQTLPVTHFLLDALETPPIWLVPALPDDLRLAHVSGLGYTHKNRKATRALSQPEQFYKGDGSTLFAHNAQIPMPEDAYSVSEEAEMVILYYRGKQGKSHQIGYTFGNDLSDPLLRRQNPDNFAASKLRPSSIGAELQLSVPPKELQGQITIKRDNNTIWHSRFITGTNYLFYSLEHLTTLLEQVAHSSPGDISYVFLGADRYSFQDNVEIINDDVIHIESGSFNLPLSNQIIIKSFRKD